jgi:hypothetical protein
MERGNGRVVVVAVWARLSLNPHPLNAEGAAPKFQDCVEGWASLKAGIS